MTEENNTTPELGLIKWGDGTYRRLTEAVLKFDIVDAAGNMLEREGFVQSPDSIRTLTAADLSGCEKPVQAIADKIFNTNEG